MDPEKRKTLSLILLNNGFFFMNNFLKRKRQGKRPSCWVKEWLNRRNSLSTYQTILSELRQNEAEYFIIIIVIIIIIIIVIVIIIINIIIIIIIIIIICLKYMFWLLLLPSFSLLGK